VRKDHALPCLARIDPQDSAYRRPDIKGHTTKSGSEAYRVVSQLEIVRGGFTDIQNNLAILDVLSRHRYAVKRRINNNVWCVIVVTHPLMHCTNQVRTF
jgi:hypothetical protein